MALASVFEMDKQLLLVEEEPIQFVEVGQVLAFPVLYLVGALLLGVALGALSMYLLVS